MDPIEREKLQLEIDQLRQPWWKKPAYIAALVPTVLAAGSLAAAWFTGVFDAKRESLQAQVTLLDIRKAELQSDARKLTQDAKRLTEDRNKLELEKKKIQTEIKMLKQDMRVASIKLPLDRLLNGGETIWPLNNNFDAIISALRKNPDPEAIKLIERTISQEKKPKLQGNLLQLRGNLLRALFLGTNNVDYLNRLHQLTLDSAGKHKRIYWSIFKYRWQSDAFWKNAELLTNVLINRRASPSSEGELFEILTDLKNFDGLATRFQKDARCLKAVALARQMALDQNAGFFDREPALTFIGMVRPSTMIYLIGHILETEPNHDKLKSSIASIIENSGTMVSKEFERLKTPQNTVSADWGIWATSNRSEVERTVRNKLSCS